MPIDSCVFWISIRKLLNHDEYAKMCSADPHIIKIDWYNYPDTRPQNDKCPAFWPDKPLHWCIWLLCMSLALPHSMVLFLHRLVHSNLQSRENSVSLCIARICNKIPINLNCLTTRKWRRKKRISKCILVYFSL